VGKVFYLSRNVPDCFASCGFSIAALRVPYALRSAVATPRLTNVQARLLDIREDIGQHLYGLSTNASVPVPRTKKSPARSVCGI